MIFRKFYSTYSNNKLFLFIANTCIYINKFCLSQYHCIFKTNSTILKNIPKKLIKILLIINLRRKLINLYA